LTLLAITPLLLLLLVVPLLLLVVPLLLLLVEPLLAVPCRLLTTATASSSITPKAAPVAARDVDVALVAASCPPALLLLLLLLLGLLWLMAWHTQSGEHTPTPTPTPTCTPTPTHSSSRSTCPCVKGSVETRLLSIVIHVRQHLLLLGLQLRCGQVGGPASTIPGRA
jgi:hypothetical protein